MTTHELAEILLGLADVPVVLFEEGSSLTEVEDVTVREKRYYPVGQMLAVAGEVACLT